VRPVSARFLSALRGSHTVGVQALVVTPGQTGTSPTGTQLAVLGGDVTLSSTAAVRATLELMVDGTGAFPDNAGDDLAPYGNEIFVRRGVTFGGGSVEWVSLGYFRIRSAGQDDAPDGPIRVVGQDRMGGIVKARLTVPVQFPATATYGDVVSQLVLEVYPWATIEWDDLAETDALGRSLIAEEDRFAFLDELVRGLAKQWHWDHRGVLVIEAIPDPGATVWDVDSGENGVLVSMGREISDDGVYNAVVVTGEALDTETPPRAVAYDNNPTSPTYWHGDFGKVPRYYSSSFITTAAQAQTTATALLRSNLGVPYNIDFRSLVNAALEPWDPVRVRLGPVTQTHVIDTLVIPLAGDTAMRGATREQTLVVIGEGDA
jgi:hypothetical protein